MRKTSWRLTALCAVALMAVAPSTAAAMTPDQATNVTRNFIEWVFGFQLDPAIVQSLHDGAVTEMSKDPAGVQAVR